MANQLLTIPPMPAVAAILSRYDRKRLAGFISIAIDLLDTLGPDTEDEPDFRPRSDGLPGTPEDTEPNGDDRGDRSWPEWQSRGRHKQTAVGAEMTTHNPAGWEIAEDDEDDDAAEVDGDETDGNYAEDDEAASFRLMLGVPGCSISDPDKGAEDESEREQLLHDVPMLPVACAHAACRCRPIRPCPRTTTSGWADKPGDPV